MSHTKSYLVTPDWSGQTPFAPTDPPVFETGVLNSDLLFRSLIELGVCLLD